MRIAIVGASGYAGSELLRLLASHPDAEVVLATGDTSAGARVARHVPSLAALYPEMVFAPTASVFDVEAEVVFLAMPHGQSQSIVPQLLERGSSVVDLGADFRLKKPEDYERWFGEVHRAPQLLDTAVYGLVERHRDELSGARLIAVPGCYPTASSLALGPLVDRGLIEPSGVIVNALSGASGAGRATSERLHFSRLAANAEAYGLLSHRHTPEIEQELGAQVLFTPHLVPVSRGMLVTAYGRATSTGTSTEDALSALREAYAGEPFVVVSEEPPTLKDPLSSNLCLVSARVDPRTGWVVAMSSIDNLVKGAAGQAIQAWNVARGVDETIALSRAGVTP